MTHGHATLEVRWDGRASVAIGARSHVVGTSVVVDGEEKGLSGRWDFDGDTLIVRGHPHGYAPIFVHESDGRIIVGTSPLALVAAGADPALDREGLGAFLRLGFHVGERTPFARIRLAPRGMILRWRQGRRVDEGPGLTVMAPRVRSIDQGIAGYCELFREAMRRRPPSAGLDGHFAMPLSGGRDSRMILLEAMAQGHSPGACVTVTRGNADQPDAVIARRLAQRVGVPLVEVGADGQWIEHETRKHVLASCLALEHTWILPLCDALRACSPGWYDGLGAGVLTRSDLCQHALLELYRAGQWSELLESISARAFSLPRRSVEVLGHLVDWIETSDESTVELLSEELLRYQDAANPLAAFSFVNWCGRAISVCPTMLCALSKNVHTPFMDLDLVRFLLGVPLEMALENDLQTDALHRLHPLFADVPFDKDLPAPTRRRQPVLEAIGGRVATMRRLRAASSTFRSVGTRAALTGDGRLAGALAMLGLLERASSSSGAQALLDELGPDSPADRAALDAARRRWPGLTAPVAAQLE